MKRLSIGTALLVLCGVLATFTALIPMASAWSASRTNRTDDCARNLERIAEKIQQFKTEHNRLPWSLSEINEEGKCPVCGNAYWYRGGNMTRPDLISEKQKAAYREMIDAVDWTKTPILKCDQHFDDSNVVSTLAVNGRIVPGTDGTPLKVLSVTLGGTASYQNSHQEIDDVVAQFFAANTQTLGGGTK